VTFLVNSTFNTSRWKETCAEARPYRAIIIGAFPMRWCVLPSGSPHPAHCRSKIHITLAVMASSSRDRRFFRERFCLALVLFALPASPVPEDPASSCRALKVCRPPQHNACRALMRRGAYGHAAQGPSCATDGDRDSLHAEAQQQSWRSMSIIPSERVDNPCNVFQR
jgi:hypothetical protein